jgi:hypothetical protein
LILLTEQPNEWTFYRFSSSRPFFFSQRINHQTFKPNTMKTAIDIEKTIQPNDIELAPNN